MPLDGPSREDVREALGRVLAWPGLARSPQLAKFLEYVVEAALRDDTDAIKAYAIAVDVLGRGAEFDPQRDPIVRVQARRLRSLLDEYYATDGAGEPLRIRLPVGRYVPAFEVAGAQGVAVLPAPRAAVPDTSRPAARGPGGLAGVPQAPLIVALVAVIVGLLASLALFIGAPRAPRPPIPEAPSIAVSDFQIVAGSSPAVVASVTGLAVQLVRDLQLFTTIGPTYLVSDSPPGSTAPRTTYVLAGLARAVGDSVQVTATLRPTGSDVTIWSQTIDAASNSPDGILTISRAITERLGSMRGPLHATAMQWLADNRIPPGAESDYACSLLFGRYRDSVLDVDRATARGCVDGLLEHAPDSSTALALSAGLAIDEALDASSTPSFDAVRLATARGMLDKARGLNSTSSLVWEQWARLATASGNREDADKNFAVAVQLNPADLDVVAEYARMLVLGGDSPRGNAMAVRALSDAPSPPFWYHAATAVNAFRGSADAEALKEAEALASGDGELGPAIAAAAAQRSGDQVALDRDIARLLEAKRFRRFGVLPVLRQRLADAGLVDTIADQLRAAGVPDAALNGSF